MNITDTHCHLASHRYEPEEVESLIRHSKECGVSRIITLSTSLDDIGRNLEIANHEGVYAGIGVHPCDVHHAPDDVVSELLRHVHDPRVCVIGETGLDYYHPAPEGWETEAFRQRQRDLLHQHFQVAQEAQLNIVIHTRDAAGNQSFQDALSIYKNYAHQVRAVFHCFISSWEEAQEVLACGGLVSFGGVATFKSAHLVREVIQKCPLESFMLETDAPYLSPEPYRGQRNEPARTMDIAIKIASVKDMSLNDLAEVTEQVAEKFFRFTAQ